MSEARCWIRSVKVQCWGIQPAGAMRVESQSFFVLIELEQLGRVLNKQEDRTDRASVEQHFIHINTESFTALFDEFDCVTTRVTPMNSARCAVTPRA